MPTFHNGTSTSDLTVDEKAWCKKLEKLLLSAPARFGLSTSGDCDLQCFDEVAANERGIAIEDANMAQAGLRLATIQSRARLHGLCG